VFEPSLIFQSGGLNGRGFQWGVSGVGLSLKVILLFLPASWLISDEDLGGIFNDRDTG
jgi:hypothetical protein